ncbi:MAG TPA: hypothetical protein VF937_12425 [Chloroflexota bacterium]
MIASPAVLIAAACVLLGLVLVLVWAIGRHLIAALNRLLGE